MPEWVSDVAAVLACLASVAVAILMWWGIKVMKSTNTARAAQAVQDREAMMKTLMHALTMQQTQMQAQMVQQAEEAAKDRYAMQAQMTQAMTQMTQAMTQADARMSEDRKVTQGLLKALENQGMVLESLIRGNGSARQKDQRGHAPRQPAPGE